MTGTGGDTPYTTILNQKRDWKKWKIYSFTLSITEPDLVYHKGFALIPTDWIKKNSFMSKGMNRKRRISWFYLLFLFDSENESKDQQKMGTDLPREWFWRSKTKKSGIC